MQAQFNEEARAATSCDRISKPQRQMLEYVQARDVVVAEEVATTSELKRTSAWHRRNTLRILLRKQLLQEDPYGHSLRLTSAGRIAIGRGKAGAA